MPPRTSSFAKTRRDHAFETAEDYVEAINDILSSHSECRVRDLAHRMEVSHVTVTRILSRLETEGLVLRERYGPVRLTANGRRIARASRSRHELMLAFLLAIGVPEAAAASDAEGMEHHASSQTLSAMRAFLKDR